MPQLRVGSLVWAPIPGDSKGEPRACVVTAFWPFTPYIAEVVYGQDHPPKTPLAGPGPHKVIKTSTLGTRLGLSKDTHFCAREIIYTSTITRVITEPCPNHDQLQIEAIAEAQRTG
jgi:hypothetical protein